MNTQTPPPTPALPDLRDYELALASQSACNLSGIVKTLAVTLDRIWNQAREEKKGTDFVNTHPICRLYAEQIAHLTGGPDRHSSYYEAFTQVEARVAELKAPPVVECAEEAQ